MKDELAETKPLFNVKQYRRPPVKQTYPKVTLVLSCGCSARAIYDMYKIGAFVICPNCHQSARIDNILRGEVMA